MGKDRTENIDRYKVRGGHLNEYEYQRNEGELEESREGGGPEGGEGLLRGAAEPNAPQNLAERIRQIEQRAHEIVERRRAKRGEGGAGRQGAAGAKKGASRGGAKRGVKRAAKKGGAGKAAAKGGASKRGAPKPSGGKKSSAGGKRASAARGAKKGAGAKKSSAAKKSAKKGAAKKVSRARG
jgi:DNA end-binding protein Ku